MTASILIAVDGSPRTEDVFRAGAAIARARRGGILLYRAVIIPHDFAHPASRPLGPLPPFLVDRARIDLLELSLTVPDLPCATRIDIAAQPWRAVVDAADGCDASLIVLGSDGYHGADHGLGTTAAKVVSVARRNVLVVRDHARGRHSVPKGGA